MGKSSYSRGIENLLKNSRKFENIMMEYIIRTNSRYFSNVFPSTQLAKVVLDKLDEKKTKFPIIHKIIREILKQWEKNNLCIHVTTTKYSKSRTKTKEVYRFHQGGLNELKKEIISASIERIEEGMDKTEIPTDSLKTREDILEGFQTEIEDFFRAIEFETDIEFDHETEADEEEAE